MGRIPDDYDGASAPSVDEDDGPPTTRIKNTPPPPATPRRRMRVDLEGPDKVLDEPRPPQKPAA
ncbi:hypothetical protein IT087_01310 [Candidatus Uhrbacteria bacterium]|nr:hypothetical protein [Candidatus Uhrbacteria bacterium]